MTFPTTTVDASIPKTMSGQAIGLSFVIPVYNEEEVFDSLVERLKAVMDQATMRCEVVMVDDGSSDRTRQLVQQICESDSRFRGVLLSRNFGHQGAVSAGLDYARGAAVGVIDGDLQDPPELLLDFHAKLAEGYDVVYAVRRNRKEGPIKRLCYWAFYRIMKKMAAIDMPLDSGDFCLMSRAVVQKIQAMPERHRFIRGLRSWVGFRQTGFEYDREARHAGESKYTFSKLIQLAMDGLLTFSETPLRIATFSGAAVALLAMLWGAYLILWRLAGGTGSIPGFATVACGMLFLGGVQLICLGILGEYIARIHNEVKGRPVYIVEETLGQAQLLGSDRRDNARQNAPSAPNPLAAPPPGLTGFVGSHGGTEAVEALIQTLQQLPS